MLPSRNSRRSRGPIIKKVSRLAAVILPAALAAVLLPAASAMPAHAQARSMVAAAGGGLAVTGATITGTLTWKQVDQAQNQPSGFSSVTTQKGTFTIDATLTRLADGTWTSHSVGSTYDYSYDGATTSAGSCPSKTTVTGSSTGPLADPSPQNTAGTLTVVGYPLPSQFLSFVIGGPVTLTSVKTDCTGTTSSTSQSSFYPYCFNSQMPGLTGQLTAADPVTSITIDCSDQLGGGASTATATGTLTIITSSLAITAPPDGSIVANTDPSFFTPQPKADERAPKARSLIVSGYTDCPSVTVNGVKAVVSGTSWRAELPVTAAGPVQLTAKAGACGEATTSATIISLDIVTPSENGAAPITAAPAMPDLNASVQVSGYPDQSVLSATPLDWTLDTFGHTVRRPGTWTGYDKTTTGTTTGIGDPWQPQYDEIAGGIGRLVVTANLPGVLDNPVTSDPRWFKIPGTNPPAATLRSYLDQQEPDSGYASTIWQIMCVESRWHQFNTPGFTPGNNGEPPVPGVPADWQPNPGTLQPLYGPPAGIGVTQQDRADAALPMADYWDWQANVRDGIAEFHRKLDQASHWAAAEQHRLTVRLNQVLHAANQQRAAHNPAMPPLHMTAITVPALTAAQVLRQAIRLYNGGNEYHFNADYVLSANDLNVELTGTSAWESKPAGIWGPAPADLHNARKWIALDNKFQGYVNDVLKCPN